ncbi:MAG: NAD(P)H-binding protein [Bacteroidota bacterium]
MKILLLGATGRTGKHILAQCLEKGLQVNCLVRDSSKVTPANGLEIYQGDVANKSDLMRASNGCSQVVSILNISRKSDFPWSKLRTPPTLLSDTMHQLIEVVKTNDIQKITVCSAWGVAESKKDIPVWFRWMIDNSNIGVAYKDHQKQEEILKSSGLNYTIVRPVGLTNAKIHNVRESFNNQPKPTMLISRKTVASYFVECLMSDSADRKVVTISKA